MSATCRAMRQIPTWLHHGYDPTTLSTAGHRAPPECSRQWSRSKICTGPTRRQFQPSFQLRELFLRPLVAAPRQKLAKHFSDRVEGRVLEKCPGRRFDPGMRRTRD